MKFNTRTTYTKEKNSPTGYTVMLQVVPMERTGPCRLLRTSYTSRDDTNCVYRFDKQMYVFHFRKWCFETLESHSLAIYLHHVQIFISHSDCFIKGSSDRKCSTNVLNSNNCVQYIGHPKDVQQHSNKTKMMNKTGRNHKIHRVR